MNIDPKGVAALASVVTLGNFEKAANQLCITQSAVSQRIKLLESKLEQTLLIRSSPLRPTKAGSAVLKYAQQVSQLERALSQTLNPKRNLDWVNISIAVNADSLATWLLGALADWCKQERVLLDFHIHDQEATHQLLQEGLVTACVSANEHIANTFQGSYLGTMTYHCMASPAFKAYYFPEGVNAQSFAQAPMVRFNHSDFLQHQYLQQYFQLDADLQPQHILASSEGYMEWIRLGLGFGMLPYMQAKPLLDKAELVYLTPDKPMLVPLFWHQWGIKTKLNQQLKKHIEQAAKLALL